MQAVPETPYGLARGGRVNTSGEPKPLQAGVIAWRYRDDWVPAGVPAPVWALVFPFQAATGSMRGYRPWYPAYVVPSAEPAK
jgi:hypothetical protein